MTNKYAKIIYTLSTILFIGALGLLFFRQAFIDYYREQSGVTKTETIVIKPSPQESIINTEVLSGGVLSSLSNQVKVFSFDEICSDSVYAPAACRVGNSNPFLKK